MKSGLVKLVESGFVKLDESGFVNLVASCSNLADMVN